MGMPCVVKKWLSCLWRALRVSMVGNLPFSKSFPQGALESPTHFKKGHLLPSKKPAEAPKWGQQGHRGGQRIYTINPIPDLVSLGGKWRLTTPVFLS